MGWGLRLLAAFVMLATFTTGVWPLSLTCLLYLVYSFWPRRSRTGEPRRSRFGISPRYLLAALLLVLSALAASAGGRLSPVVFLFGGLLVILYPKLSPSITEVVPLDGTVLLRSRHFPFRWHMAARVEPTQEELPRALASFRGTLIVSMREGKVYCVASCIALTRHAAESGLLGALRDSASKLGTMAYLLPLDPSSDEGPINFEFKASRLPKGDLAERARGVEGFLSLQVEGGAVQAVSAHVAKVASRRKAIPYPGRRLQPQPLLWEVLEDIGKSVRWAEADPCASILESLGATRSESLGEGVDGIQGNGRTLTIRTLGGESLEIPRVQFRAAVAIYPVAGAQSGPSARPSPPAP
jgi:hypothetical protein